MLQTLFICTGCDYVSYFAGIGKSTLLKVFFQHASFVNGVSQGTLASTCDTRVLKICVSHWYCVF